jgi:hypothetical protein
MGLDAICERARASTRTACSTAASRAGCTVSSVSLLRMDSRATSARTASRPRGGDSKGISRTSIMSQPPSDSGAGRTRRRRVTS